MFKCKRWLGLVLCLVMAVSMMLPVSAVDPLSTGLRFNFSHPRQHHRLPGCESAHQALSRGSSGLIPGRRRRAV